MEESARPEPQNNSQKEEFEEKIAELIADALYEEIVKKKTASPKTDGQQLK